MARAGPDARRLRHRPEGEAADHLARFALAAFNGGFVAYQSHPELTLGAVLEHLQAALRRDLA